MNLAVTRYPMPMQTAAAKQPLDLSVWLLLSFLGAIVVIGKGPTYLGIPPLYWGEAVLAVSLCWMARRGGLASLLFPGPFGLSLAITLFCLIGGILLAANLPAYGLDAVRDSAMWYYSGFYFVGLYLAKDERRGDRVWGLLVGFWVASMLWSVADRLSGNQLSEMGPIIPWRGVSVLSNSNSEQVQHMATGALIVLGTDLVRTGPIARAGLVIASLTGLGLFLADVGRASKVGIIGGLMVVLFLGLGRGRAIRMGSRLLPWMGAALGLLIVVAFAMELDFAKMTNLNRFQDSGGTNEWRTIWWQQLYQGVLEENRAFGLGFGRDWQAFNPLISAEGFDPWPVRAPHNFNVTVFSRMGFVGLGLWAVILLLGIGGLFARTWRSQFGPERQQEMAVWVLVLLATWGNASFGVLMEGPVLGVWFWFALGFAWSRSGGGRPAAGMGAGQPNVGREARA